MFICDKCNLPKENMNKVLQLHLTMMKNSNGFILKKKQFSIENFEFILKLALLK